MRRRIIIMSLIISNSKIYKNIKEIKKIMKYSEKEKKEYQLNKLKSILFHSYKNVPYYTELFKKHKIINDKDEINLKKFKEIPFLTKDIIRNNSKKLQSNDISKRQWEFNTSGGSTGEPIKLIQDKNYKEWNIANKIWIKKHFGNHKIGEKELRFWGSERDLLEGKESLKIRIRNWLYNRKEFNTFKMTEEDMFNYVEKWNEYKPYWVESYVQSIYEFAKFVKEKNLKIYSPKNGILTSAGTLYPHMQELIEEVFNCKVYNRYGSREVGDMACGHNELLLSIWNHYIEIIEGKIYVTTLNNYSMPLIRYEIGDIGIKGNNWQYIEKVEGREMSMIKTKKGKLIPGEFFIHFIGVVHNKGFIDKFQVIQKDLNNITIKIISKNISEFKKNKTEIEKSINKETENSLNINWKIVKTIKPLKSGKYEYVRSEVK